MISFVYNSSLVGSMDLTQSHHQTQDSWNDPGLSLFEEMTQEFFLLPEEMVRKGSILNTFLAGRGDHSRNPERKKGKTALKPPLELL